MNRMINLLNKQFIKKFKAGIYHLVRRRQNSKQFINKLKVFISTYEGGKFKTCFCS